MRKRKRRQRSRAGGRRAEDGPRKWTPDSLEAAGDESWQVSADSISQQGSARPTNSAVCGRHSSARDREAIRTQRRDSITLECGRLGGPLHTAAARSPVAVVGEASGERVSRGASSIAAIGRKRARKHSSARRIRGPERLQKRAPVDLLA